MPVKDEVGVFEDRNECVCDILSTTELLDCVHPIRMETKNCKGCFEQTSIAKGLGVFLSL